MNILKKLFFVGALVAVPFSYALCYEGPRVAVGWFSNNVDSGVAIYNPLTGEQLLRKDFPHMTDGVGNAAVYLSFLSPYDNSLLASFNRNNIWVYNQGDEIVESEPATEKYMTACLLVENGDNYQIVVPTQGGSIKAYDAHTGNVVISFEFTGHEGEVGYQAGVMSLAMYQQDGKPFLVSGSTAGYIDIYDYQTGKLVKSINTYANNGFFEPSWINTVVVFQNGDSIKIVASTCNTPQDKSGQLGCWDAITGEKEYVVWYCDTTNPCYYNSGDIYSLQLYKDSDETLKLVTSAADREGMIKIWDPLTGRVIQSLYDERFLKTNTVALRAFESEDETGKVIKFVAGYMSGEIAVWNTRTGLVEACVNQNENTPKGVSKLVRFISLFNFQNKQYCTVGNDNGDVYTYVINGLQRTVNWSVGQRNPVFSLANPQELLTDPTKSQLGFFNLMLGCYVPFVDLNNFRIISTNVE